MSKNLGLLLVCSQPYVRHIEDAAQHEEENRLLFDAISNVYLPLLNALNALDGEGVSFSVSMVIPPVLATLLLDPEIQEQYLAYVEKRIILGGREVERLSGDERLLLNARRELAKARQDKEDFSVRYKGNLVLAFAELSRKGRVELLATTGTDAYLPHYCDMTEIVNAQVETGLFSFRKTFNEFPAGFYLPHLGYERGLDEVLKSYNMHYTVLSAKSLLFSSSAHGRGVFYPYRFADSTLSFLADDFDSDEEIARFAENAVYKNSARDIGYEIPSGALSDLIGAGGVRVSTGFRYWTKGDDVYDEERALRQAEIDARIFLKGKNERLSRAAELLDDDVSLVSVIPLEKLRVGWVEGVRFVESVLRLAGEFGIASEKCVSLTKKQFKMTRVQPYACSGEGDVGDRLLDGTNAWLLRYSRKMCRRMIDISGRFPNERGLKVRLLNIGSRELLLSMSSALSMMIHDGSFAGYAEDVFQSCIRSFTIMYDALGSNTVSTEWLTSLEKKHPIFPWMNFRIFSPKNALQKPE